MDLHQSHVEFKKTHWSLIEALRSDDESDRADALARLSQIYWPAVYSFLRKRGQDQENAAEITQAFFSDVILNRKLFSQADASRAKLRTFILKALQNYMVDQHRRSTSRGEHLKISLEQTAKIEEDMIHRQDDPPDKLYNRLWAGRLLLEALKRCEKNCEGSKSQHWSIFMDRVIQPAINGSAAPTSKSLAEQYGIDSASSVNSIIYSLRKRMLVTLKQVVAETTSDPEAAEDEYVTILKLLS
ncbi:MAG: hypothetical protein O7G85_02100 [Planctomycetota bacterium]|nr:hypothetical protein [Planctomycetota bacterium]